MNLTHSICPLALLPLLLSTPSPAQPPTPPPVELTRLPDSGLQPRIALSDDNTVHLIYLTGDPKAADIQYRSLAPAAKDFSPPVRVNSEPASAIALGTVRGPSIAVDPSGRVHVLWNGSEKAHPRPKLPDGSSAGDAPVLYTHSLDKATDKPGGKSTDKPITFEPQRSLMTSSWSLDGGASIAADRSGRVAAVWHAADSAKPAGEENRGVFIAWSTDRGNTFANEARIPEASDGACACCAAFACFDKTDHLAILYRRAFKSTERDASMLFEVAPNKYSRTRLDPWPINACPMTTSDAFPVKDGLLLAWETKGQVWVGKWNGTLIQTMTAAPGKPTTRKHPRVTALLTGEVLLAWTEGTAWEKGGAVAWQLFDNSLAPTGAPGHADGLPAWDTIAVWPRTDHFTLIY